MRVCWKWIKTRSSFSFSVLLKDHQIKKINKIKKLAVCSHTLFLFCFVTAKQTQRKITKKTKHTAFLLDSHEKHASSFFSKPASSAPSFFFPPGNADPRPYITSSSNAPISAISQDQCNQEPTNRAKMIVSILQGWKKAWSPSPPLTGP